MTTLTLPYPISVNRYWRNSGKGFTYISAEGKKFKNTVIKEHQWTVRPTAINVALKITIHPKATKSGDAYKTIIDLDNGLKCILDSLNGIAYHDDKQVQDIHITYGASVLGGATTVSIFEI